MATAIYLSMRGCKWEETRQSRVIKCAVFDLVVSSAFEMIALTNQNVPSLAITTATVGGIQVASFIGAIFTAYIKEACSPENIPLRTFDQN